jgi:antitoxin component of MazEF toxin-antitoxin module
MNPDPSIPTRIVEPETVHVHQPITRMDGSPAFTAPAEVAEVTPEECVECSVAGDEAMAKSTRRTRRAESAREADES